MPLLLRQIRKSKWYKTSDVDWLREGELQADALGDISTSSNSLSVWEITEPESNLDVVIAALAAGRDAVSNFDFALFTQRRVLESDITIKNSSGKTCDEQVNQFHRELTELSSGKLFALAKIIQDDAKRERWQEPKVLGLISSAIATGRFKADVLPKNIKNRLDKYTRNS